MMELNTFLLTAVTLFGTAIAYVPYTKEYEEYVYHGNLKTSEFKIPGLYWKAYTGPPAPEDAVLAGMTRIHRKDIGLYIGQAPFKVDGAQVQAVAIYNNSEYVTSTYTRTVHTKDDIKILCADTNTMNSGLVWVPADEFDEFEPDEDFVIIGHEFSKVTHSNTNLFIGRGTYRGNLLVGKVVMGFRSFRFYPYVDDQETLVKDDFEILAYSKSYFKLKER